MIAINATQIQSMLDQIRATADQINPLSGGIRPVENNSSTARKPESVASRDFASAFRAALDSVNDLQVRSEELGEQFALGNDSVQLSDVMISMQKANIALQTTVQARNRLVSAYQEIMGMSI